MIPKPPPLDGRFTMRFTAAAFLVTALVFGGLVVYMVQTYRVTSDIVRKEFRLKELAGQIVHLNEVLSMSARMAAVTQESGWEDRYERFEKRLSSSIEEAKRLAPEVSDEQAAYQISGANVKLIEMEKLAFDAVDEGRIDEAKEILFGQRYELQKQIFSDGAARFAERLIDRANATLSAEHEKLVLFLAVMVGILPILVTAWIAVLWTLRRWQKAIEENRLKMQLQIEETEFAKKELERDIAERMRLQEAYRESENRLQLVTRATNDAVWDWDLHTNQIWWNEGVHTLFGYVGEKENLDVNWWSDHIHSGDRDQVMSGIHSVIEGGGEFWASEYRFRRSDGSYAHVYDRGYVLRDSAGKPMRMIGAMMDISDRKQVEEQLLHDAFHDAATGLPNRTLFMDRLGRSIGRGKRRTDYMFAVLFLDVDRFKIVNDSLGHMIGDQLLKAMVQRLLSSLRPSDTLARFGGDKFTVLLEDIGDVSDATRVADRIQKELTVPFNLGKQEVFITVSIGIAQSTSGYEQPEDFLRDAETAMYRAKTLGRARYQVFDAAMHSRAVTLLQLETDLRKAIERNEFVIHFQPIVSLKTNRISGFEALVRWNHPQRGLLPPGEFLPVIGEMGMILQLDHLVLRESCRQLHEWHEKHPQTVPVTVSVNISGKHFAHPGLVDFVDQVLKETRLDPRTLKLEIPESGIMENLEMAERALFELKERSIGFMIDDFGTGHSSLSALNRFPIETLKIDRSFVMGMDKGEDNMEIVRAIIALAHTLSMNVVAEGIETETQLGALKQLGCEFGQGYFFSKPVDPKTAETYLNPALKVFGNGTPTR
jgi:diguanylate cyclase (GGDEF)-like protein/PAS domain S-box-containing protein